MLKSITNTRRKVWISLFEFANNTYSNSIIKMTFNKIKKSSLDFGKSKRKYNYHYSSYVSLKFINL